MADAWHHALSSVKRWGGEPAQFYPLHAWFDASKTNWCDPRHRAARHHSEGIAQAIELFGPTIDRGDGRQIPTRWVAERHVLEDLGFVPTLKDWLECLEKREWMNRPLKLSREF